MRFDPLPLPGGNVSVNHAPPTTSSSGDQACQSQATLGEPSESEGKENLLSKLESLDSVRDGRFEE
jgi:hypothetical protein